MPNEIRHVNQKCSIAGHLFSNCLHQTNTNSQIYIANHSGSIACFVNLSLLIVWENCICYRSAHNERNSIEWMETWCKQIALFPFHKLQNGTGRIFANVQKYYPGKKNVSCTKTTEWRSQRELKRSKINIRWDEEENRGKKHQTNDCFPKAYLFSCWTNRFLFVSNITLMPAFMKKNTHNTFDSLIILGCLFCLHYS